MNGTLGAPPRASDPDELNVEDGRDARQQPLKGSLAFWMLFAAAAGIRLAAVSGASGSQLFADMEQYQASALHLYETGTLYPNALRGPGYPGALAVSYRLWGAPSLLVARILNVALGVVLVLLTTVLASRAGAGRRAWIAGAIVAAYPAWVLFSVYIMPETLYAALALAAILLLAESSSLSWALAGVACGAAILTRSVGISVAAAAIVVAFLAATPESFSRRLARLSLFVVACAVTLTPWLVHTTRVAGGPLLDATSGFNLLAGNNPRATGRLELDQVEWLNATYINGAATASAGNAKAIVAGLDWATSHPRESVRLGAAKLGYLFGLDGREHAWLYGHGYFGPRAMGTVWAWGVALLASFPLLIGASAIGAGGVSMSIWRQPVHLASTGFVVATALLHVVSFGESRFHLPLVPVLAVWASLSRPLAQRKSTAGWALAALLLLMLTPAWMPQARDLASALQLLAQPGGATTVPPY